MRWLLLLPMAATAACGSDPTGPAVLEPGTFAVELVGDVSGAVTGSATLTDVSEVGVPFAIIELRASTAEAPFRFSLWVVPLPPGRPEVGKLSVLSAKYDGRGRLGQGVFAVAQVKAEGGPALTYSAVDGTLDIRKSDHRSLVGSLHIDASKLADGDDEQANLSLRGEFHAQARLMERSSK